MRRRRRPLLHSVPDELARFDLGTWLPLVAEDPPVDVSAPAFSQELEAVRLWREARRRWSEKQPWPAGALERLVQERAVRRSIASGLNGDRGTEERRSTRMTENSPVEISRGSTPRALRPVLPEALRRPPADVEQRGAWELARRNFATANGLDDAQFAELVEEAEARAAKTGGIETATVPEFLRGRS